MYFLAPNVTNILPTAYAIANNVVATAAIYAMLLIHIFSKFYNWLTKIRLRGCLKFILIYVNNCSTPHGINL